MEKHKKKSTIFEKELQEALINDTKRAFYLLHKVKKERGISTVYICDTLGISKSSYYRYISEFDSQNRCSPKVNILNKFLNALGYEILIVEKNNEKDVGN